MPQATIEFSSNIKRSFDARGFAHLLHDQMVALIDTDLESCKTRLMELDNTLIGDGSSDKAMIHVDIRILSGRTQQQKTALGQAAVTAAQSCLTERPANLQLTVEVGDIDAENYHKVVLEALPNGPGRTWS